MHKERIKRHGYPDLKKERGEHALEKIPHIFDNFILKSCKYKIDSQIAQELQMRGCSGATTWNVKYRRRKLGVKKYLYGEIQKHKAWIRSQAINRYGKECELCGYDMVIDTHHILPKHRGGSHEVENLMVVCPNCHALITRKLIKIQKRLDIERVSREVRGKIKIFYDKKH